MVSWVSLQFVIVVFPDHTHYLLLYISLLHVWVLRTGVWFELCHFLVTAHVILVKVVPVPGYTISILLYESIESCEALLKVEWQPDLSTQQTIFSLDYGMQVDIMC